MIFEAIAVIFALSAMVWTILPLFRGDAWWIRGFEFPRVQVIILSVLAFLAYGLAVGWSRPLDVIVLAALAICVVFQLTRIAPYTVLYPHQLKAAESQSRHVRLSVLVVNVLTPNRNADGLLHIIRDADPDVVLAVETDDWWESKLDTLEDEFTYAVKHPRDNLYGMHLYSKLELTNVELMFLVEDDVPSIHADITLSSGDKVALHCVHPAPPSPTENQTSAERDAELLTVAKTIDADAQPVVVMGDLNDVAWSATTRLFQQLSKLLDPRIGRGMFNTYNAKYPFMRWPLDHVFCSRHFRLVSMRRLPFFGSDHFPMYAVLAYEPEGVTAQEEPEAQAADVAEAEDKINKRHTDDAALLARTQS